MVIKVIKKNNWNAINPFRFPAMLRSVYIKNQNQFGLVVFQYSLHKETLESTNWVNLTIIHC